MPAVRYTVVNGEVIAEKRNGVRRLYVPDPLGSTVALVDNTQTITDRFSYWPYGEEASRTGTTPTPFRFVGTQGYYRDRLNSIYVRGRHYRPDVGRWMTEDPLRGKGEPAGRYAYSRARPASLTDPSGLLPRCFWECLGPYPLCLWCLSHLPGARPCHYECDLLERHLCDRQGVLTCVYGCMLDEAEWGRLDCPGYFETTLHVRLYCEDPKRVVTPHR